MATERTSMTFKYVGNKLYSNKKCRLSSISDLKIYSMPDLEWRIPNYELHILKYF